jgi:FkbM family methyltransferase
MEIQANQSARKFIKRLVPQSLHTPLSHMVYTILKLYGLVRMLFFRLRVRSIQNGACVGVENYKVMVTDGPNLIIEYKDIFLKKIYHFESKTSRPYIIDGGANIGMSVLYFKKIYPESRIVCFEPDPEVFKILRHNIQNNNLTNVDIINAGLYSFDGELSFLADGQSGGHLVTQAELDFSVQVCRISRFIEESVDFIKLNIEGAEAEVLREIEVSGKFRHIHQMVIEYHGWPNPAKQELGSILELLDRNDFRWIVHDFDEETCATTKPPFRLTDNTSWFCLIYARNTNCD